MVSAILLPDRLKERCGSEFTDRTVCLGHSENPFKLILEYSHEGHKATSNVQNRIFFS